MPRGFDTASANSGHSRTIRIKRISWYLLSKADIGKVETRELKAHY